jgi:hypothetical protein
MCADLRVARAASASTADVENSSPVPTTMRGFPPEAENEKERAVKYILLIYNNQETYQAWSEAERDALMGDVDLIMSELTESGELVGGQALADPSTGKTVRVRDGVPVTTDGPFAEAKEQLAGYLIVECDSEERAVEIAARWPDARYFAMEVRAIMHTSGAEM